MASNYKDRNFAQSIVDDLATDYEGHADQIVAAWKRIRKLTDKLMKELE